jgi:hypothetical protein
VTCVAIGAIFDTIVVTRDTRDMARGKRLIPLFPFSLLPLFIRDALELDEWRH